MELLTAKELGQMLRLTTRSIYRLQREGRIPASIKIAPGSSRWDGAEVLKFLRSAPRFQAETAD